MWLSESPPGRSELGPSAGGRGWGNNWGRLLFVITSRRSEFGDHRSGGGGGGGRHVGQRLSWFENHWVGDQQGHCSQHHLIMFKDFNGTRLWPAFGRQSLVWSSFEYSYTRLASRLRRSARSLNTERKCLETAETTKSLNTERKCLETAEPTKSLNTERKCLETVKRQNPLVVVKT